MQTQRPRGVGEREQLAHSFSSGEAGAAIRALVEARLSVDDAAGIAVAVTDLDGILGLVAAGFADLASGIRMEVGGRMPIGSIGKTLTGIAALQLAEQGKLDLHARLDKHLRWFDPRACSDGHGTPVTMHHLLTHTSGLPLGTDFCDSAHHVAWAWGRRRGWAAPGARFVYSNDAFKIAGVIVEAVAGEPVDRYVEEHILAPLDMRASVARLTAEERGRCIVGYTRASDRGPAQRAHPRSVAPWVLGASADGSVISSASDLCALVRMLMRGGRGDDGSALMSASAFELMRGPYAPIPAGLLGSLGQEATYGYGLCSEDVDGCRHIWHRGSIPGFRAIFLADLSQQIGVVVLANGEADVDQIARFALAAARATRSGWRLPSSPSVDPFAVVRPQTFAATFAAGDEFTTPRNVALVVDRDHVVLVDDNGQVTLEPSKFIADSFLVARPEWEKYLLRVERNAARAPAALTLGPRWWQRVSDAGVEGEGCAKPSAGGRHAGRYLSRNPVFPCLDVFCRRGALMLAVHVLDGYESPLVDLGGGVFRVGAEEWHPERLVFDAIVDGRATRARLDFETFYRET